MTKSNFGEALLEGLTEATAMIREEKAALAALVRASGHVEPDAALILSELNKRGWVLVRKSSLEDAALNLICDERLARGETPVRVTLDELMARPQEEDQSVSVPTGPSSS